MAARGRAAPVDLLRRRVYQIIRPALQPLVDDGVVSSRARFDTATQDHLGRHLLRETGYRAGARSTVAADRIARVWATLPRTSGTDPGRSFYKGIAGNHALIAFIIFWSVNLIFIGAAGLFVMGFGGLKETTGAVTAYLRHLVGAGLALLCTLLAFVQDLAWDIRAAGSIPVAALAVLLADIIACLLLWVLPASISRLAKG